MLALRVSPLVSAGTAVVVLLVLGFKFPLDGGAAAGAITSLAPVTVTVAVVMFTGIAITNMQQVTGVQAALNGWLNRVIESPERGVLLYGLAVVPFFESLIGWGIGVLVGIPLLLGTGITKLKAVQIALLGLTLCPWGSFSPALLLLTEISGYDIVALGTATAMFNLVIMLILAGAITWVAGGMNLMKTSWHAVLVTVTAMGVVLVVVNLYVAPVLGGVLASLAGALVMITMSRSTSGESIALPKLALRGLIPYGVVLVGLITANSTAGLIASGSVLTLLTNPAVWLMVAVVLTPFLLHMSRKDLSVVVRQSFTSWWPVCLVTVVLILLGTLLSVNGMSATLAEGAQHLAGSFAVLVPLIGFIAGFVTTSNTAAAAMLAQPLAGASVSLGLNPVHVIGMQTAVTGAAVMCSPARVVLAIEASHLVTPVTAERISVGSALVPVLVANGGIVVVMGIIGFLWL